MADAAGPQQAASAGQGQASSAGSSKKKVMAKEDLAMLTSGAREKLDHNLASVKAGLTKLAHPFSPESRQRADAKAVEMKKQSSMKQAGIRATAQQQAEQQLMAGKGQMSEEGYPHNLADSTPTRGTGLPDSATSEVQPCHSGSNVDNNPDVPHELGATENPA